MRRKLYQSKKILSLTPALILHNKNFFLFFGMTSFFEQVSRYENEQTLLTTVCKVVTMIKSSQCNKLAVSYW